ncbi:MAG: 2-dehydropantoate 2-reductase N-terminal domain-containing protein [Filifactor alocis]|nr:2-dehydropantoate 2-reductase N-terminal domain-containing protein [Filifactor alocis]
MRILVYGAGVIGSLYAALFSKAGCEVSVYARGSRLEELETRGLLYEEGGRTERAEIRVLKSLEADDRYDYIFLAVRENALHRALLELETNCSPTIVTMVNSLEEYPIWEDICGRGRILPAFPGAGGYIEKGVLKARLTPKMIQPTTFGEVDGRRTLRLERLESLFYSCKVPYQIVEDMHTWQICHLAMVLPLARAYYEAENPLNVGKEKPVMYRAARDLKKNFLQLHRSGIVLSPPKMNLFRLLPVSILSFTLSLVFQSEFGNLFMYRHAMKAPDEMKELEIQFLSYMENIDTTK